MENVATLEAALGHSFRSSALLLQALTHSSHAHEKQDSAEVPAPRDNELLEFLGDSVLSMVTSQALFERFPERHEGELSKMRAHLVSARHLIRAAAELDLGSYLLLGRGEEKSGGRHKGALLVNALEAVIAAIYLDGGAEVARQFVMEKIVNPEFERMAGNQSEHITDFKSALQEALQSRGEPQPTYRVTSEAGPDHSKTFMVEVQIHSRNGKKSGYAARAEGRTKKSAEQAAAAQALEYLQTTSTGEGSL